MSVGRSSSLGHPCATNYLALWDRAAGSERFRKLAEHVYLSVRHQRLVGRRGPLSNHMLRFGNENLKRLNSNFGNFNPSSLGINIMLLCLRRQHVVCRKDVTSDKSMCTWCAVPPLVYAGPYYITTNRLGSHGSSARWGQCAETGLAVGQVESGLVPPERSSWLTNMLISRRFADCTTLTFCWKIPPHS
jgi:hypothetical protein